MTAITARTIRVGHSPDPDDAFMFYALAKDKLETGELRFEHLLYDIETLNHWAFESKLEITAVSLHAFAHLTDKYSLLDMGQSLGHGYGPILVVKPGTTREQVLAGPIAIPGRLTTAFLTAQLWAGGPFNHVEVPFDKVMDEVIEGRCPAALVIHEGQLTYPEHGLEVHVDLGKWWGEETGGLPLPLGVNVVRNDLGPEMMKRIAGLMHESIMFALAHRDDALTYAMEYGRGLDRDLADRFVGMYVNDSTLTLGETGEKAVRLLLERAHQAGIIPHAVSLNIVRR